MQTAENTHTRAAGRAAQLLTSAANLTPEPTKPPPEFLTDKMLADLLGVTQRTTLRWRRDGGGPPYVRLGTHRLIYLRSDVVAWMNEHRHAHRAAESVAKAA